MKKTVFFISIILLSTFSQTVEKSSLIVKSTRIPSLEKLQRYDSLRIRISPQTEREEFGVPLSVAAIDIYTKESRNYMAQSFPETVPIWNKATSKMNSGKAIFWTGSALWLTSLFILAPAGDTPLPYVMMGTGLVATLVGSPIWAKGIHLETDGFRAYDKALRAVSDSLELHDVSTSTTIPSSLEERYYYYLSKTIRVNPHQSTYNYLDATSITSGFIMDNKPLRLHPRFSEQAQDIAMANGLQATAELFDYSQRLHQTFRILNLTGTTLFATGATIALFSGIAMGVSWGESDPTNALITAAIMGGTGFLLNIVSMPIGTKGTKVFYNGLASYDDELRGRYGLGVTVEFVK